MNEFQRAAFLQAQASCAIIEAMALLLERSQGDRLWRDNGVKEIRSLIDKYGIGHNAALTYLGEP